MLQLRHGPAHPKLRRRETLEALKTLRDQKILRPGEYKILAEGYLFLRRLDHRLRLERDQSIDAFEAEPGRLQSIARALGYEKAGGKRETRAGAKLLRDYQKKREQIRSLYERYFLEPMTRQRQAGTPDRIGSGHGS
jgi:glutamate-ammonia-ligase adenylyltransferase